MEFLSKFGERLTELMQERSVNAPKLAELLKIDRSTVNGYCGGRTAPSYENLAALIKYFDCSADFLLGLTDYPPDEKLFDLPPFGERFLFCLDSCGKTRYRLTKDLHVAESAVNYWAHNKHLPQATSLVKIAEYLDCSVDFLIGRRR